MNVKQPSVYGLVELNRIAAVRTGKSFVQYELDGTDFAAIGAQNGMLLTIDHVSGKVGLPTTPNAYVYLHASVEKDYEGKGRKHFIVNRGQFNPRLYELDTGDSFESNTFQYDDGTYADYGAIKSAINSTTVYGIPSTAGLIQIVATPTGSEKVLLKVAKAVVLPNGENGLKFVVQYAKNF